MANSMIGEAVSFVEVSISGICSSYCVVIEILDTMIILDQKTRGRFQRIKCALHDDKNRIAPADLARIRDGEEKEDVTDELR